MAKIKVILENGETILDADNKLLKALNHHASGDIHIKESFEDPVMIDVTHFMESEYQKIYKDMIQEINDVLDEEYANGY